MESFVYSDYHNFDCYVIGVCRKCHCMYFLLHLWHFSLTLQNRDESVLTVAQVYWTRNATNHFCRSHQFFNLVSDSGQNPQASTSMRAPTQPAIFPDPSKLTPASPTSPNYSHLEENASRAHPHTARTHRHHNIIPASVHCADTGVLKTLISNLSMVLKRFETDEFYLF
jgi:hypothetical protein